MQETRLPRCPAHSLPCGTLLLLCYTRPRQARRPADMASVAPVDAASSGLATPGSRSSRTSKPGHVQVSFISPQTDSAAQRRTAPALRVVRVRFRHGGVHAATMPSVVGLLPDLSAHTVPLLPPSPPPIFSYRRRGASSQFFYRRIQRRASARLRPLNALSFRSCRSRTRTAPCVAHSRPRPPLLAKTQQCRGTAPTAQATSS